MIKKNEMSSDGLLHIAFFLVTSGLLSFLRHISQLSRKKWSEINQVDKTFSF